jgi:CRISPR-associated protein Csy2
MDTLIILRNIKVENANSVAGLTWGFPAISHFLGFTHALSRKLPVDWGMELDGCGVICHAHQAHAHQPRSRGHYVFALTRNPLTKDGEPPSFIEEGRMHMTVSLIITCRGLNRGTNKEEQEKAIKDLVLSQRLAGGTVISVEKVEVGNPPENLEELEKFERNQLRRLLPGFALVQRSDLLAQHTQNCKQEYPDASPLQPWLDFSTLQYESEQQEKEERFVTWNHVPKPDRGWLIPITIGYRSISDLYEPGKVTRARDSKTPFRFVESVYSLGEWVSPHRLTELEKLIWRYKAIPELGWYLCENLYQQENNELLTNI